MTRAAVVWSNRPMTKKAIKEEIKKPDILLKTVESAIDLVKTHMRLFIIGVAVFCVAALSAYGYTAYQEKKNEKVQAAIAEGVKSLEEYGSTGKKENLDKAEAVFLKVVKERQGKVYLVAKLYLATVYATEGKTDEARKIYQELSKGSPSTLAMLSERALQNLNTQ